MHYNIITDEAELDRFINFLPDILDTEVFYFCLFGRHKYCPDFPNTRDSGQLVRSHSKKADLKEKIRRMETPVGTYSRNGIIAPQECLAAYIGLNPRSLAKANKLMFTDLANRIVDGNFTSNPTSLANTAIHNALDRKFFVDFDYDDVSPEDYKDDIKRILPENSYKILKTRGGFHLIVNLAATQPLKSNWYKLLQNLPKCDVNGAKGLTPIPGCIQGGFTPYFVN